MNIKKLTEIQYEVTQKDGTEPPFDNEYWNNHKEGIYVDIVSGEPLFSSLHKYDSGSGWPSFFQAIEESNLVYQLDKKLMAPRIEVRSKNADSHLGHLFDDGPKPTGKRYCINSAALRFIAKEDLEAQGYGQYLTLFAEEKAPLFATAYFAGGCFWCTQADFEKLPGVLNVTSGYTGGISKNPTYEQVCSGETLHAEAVRIAYDPNKVSFETLLHYFWLNVDPTSKNRQFFDIGSQYRTAIFFTTEEEHQVANATLEWLKKEFPHISPVTEIKPLPEFYVAEDYHQNYAQKNPDSYQSYRAGCGRDEALKDLFGPKREEIIRKIKNLKTAA